MTSIAETLLSGPKDDRPVFQEVYIISDNPTTYTNWIFPVALLFIAKQFGT